MFQDETGFTMHPRLSRGWAKKGERLKIATTSEHRLRLNISGWVSPLLGRYGMIKTERGDRKGFLDVLHHISRSPAKKPVVAWERGTDIAVLIDTSDV